MLQEKSKQIAEMHGFDFKGSNGWLEKFRKRNNFKSVSGEAASVDEEAVDNWKAKIPENYSKLRRIRYFQCR